MTRKTLVAVLVAAALLTPAAGAHAQTFGNSEASQVLCLGLGTPRVVPGISAAVASISDASALPKVGEVFYATVVVGAIATCVDSSAGIEPIPPLGVELAISPATPLRCAYAGTAPPQTFVDLAPADGCRQTPAPGISGEPRLLVGPAADGSWPLYEANRRILKLDIPLRASRPLSGTLQLPGCNRPPFTVSCSREAAGDNLQVLITPIGGNAAGFLAPHVGLFVAPGPAAAVAPVVAGAPAPAAPAPAATPPAAPAGPAVVPSLAVASTLTLRRAVAGVPVRVRVPVAGSRVTAALTAQGVRGRVAAVSRRAPRAGTVALRLRPTRAAARALRRARPATLTLRVTVRAPGQAAQRLSSRIRLRR